MKQAEPDILLKALWVLDGVSMLFGVGLPLVLVFDSAVIALVMPAWMLAVSAIVAMAPAYAASYAVMKSWPKTCRRLSRRNAILYSTLLALPGAAVILFAALYGTPGWMKVLVDGWYSINSALLGGF